MLDDQGAVYTFGQGRFWQLGHGQDKSVEQPERVEDLVPCRSIACGGLHTLAVDKAGKLWIWGANQNGCLGITRGSATAGTYVRLPSLVENITVRSISAGWKHSAAIDTAVRVYANVLFRS